MGSPVQFRILGDKALKRKLAEIPAKARSAMGVAVYEASILIMKDAKSLIPVDTGRAKGSGFVTLPRRQDRDVLMGFGGPAKRYIVRLHEDTSAPHKKGKSAKFLEIAKNRNQKAAFEVMAQVARRELPKKRIRATKNPDIATNPFTGKLEA